MCPSCASRTSQLEAARASASAASAEASRWQARVSQLQERYGSVDLAEYQRVSGMLKEAEAALAAAKASASAEAAAAAAAKAAEFAPVKAGLEAALKLEKELHETQKGQMKIARSQVPSLPPGQAVHFFTCRGRRANATLLRIYANLCPLLFPFPLFLTLQISQYNPNNMSFKDWKQAAADREKTLADLQLRLPGLEGAAAAGAQAAALAAEKEALTQQAVALGESTTWWRVFISYSGALTGWGQSVLPFFSLFPLNLFTSRRAIPPPHPHPQRRQRSRLLPNSRASASASRNSATKRRRRSKRL